MHPTFHANLLQIHVPNNDRWYPGHQIPQIIGIGRFKDLSVDKILQHHGKGQDSLFELQHTTSDTIWPLHYEVSSLKALNQYLEAQKIKNVNELPKWISRVEESFLFMINPQQHKHCRDAMTFIDQLPQLLEEMDTQGRLHTTINTRPEHCLRYKGQGSKTQSTHWGTTHRLTRPMTHNTALHLSQFHAIAQYIHDGTFDLIHDSPPPGYVWFCHKNSSNSNHNLRYPFPPMHIGCTHHDHNWKPTRHGGRNGNSAMNPIFERFKADTAESRYNHGSTPHARTHHSPENLLAWWEHLNKVPQLFNNYIHNYRDKCCHQPYPTSKHNYNLDNLMFIPPPINPSVSESALHEQIHVHTPFNALTNHGPATDDTILRKLDLSRLELTPNDTMASGSAIDTTINTTMGTCTHTFNTLVITFILIILLPLAQVLVLTDQNNTSCQK